MDNELTIEDKNTGNMTLQEYADLYCAGDRFRAIYELVDSDTAGSFDRHIDDLSQDEARFVLWLVRDSAVKAYGEEGTFHSALKANTLAETLGVDIDNIRPETKNPFAKKLILSIICIFAAIAIAVLTEVFEAQFNVNIAYIGEILIGLASLGVAGHIFQFLRFKKLQKLAASLPTADVLKAKEYCPPPFEEAFALFRQETVSQPVVEKEEAARLLHASGKQIVKSLLWMLGYVAAILVCVFIAYNTGIIGGVIGSLGLVVFFIWQVVTIFRCLHKSKVVSNTKGADEPLQRKMNTQQGLLALAAIGVSGLYLVFTVVGCLVSVMIALQR